MYWGIISSMYVNKCLTQLFQSSKVIPFDNSSRFILFSDCHRGDNSWADDFAENRNIFYHALNYYYNNGFTYIELGDGDELWENKKFSDIRKAHSNVFKLMAKFHNKSRLYLIYGNHDKERQDERVVKETLYGYYSLGKGRYEELLNGIEVYEGLVLKHKKTENKIFLIHGHQADPINDNFWLIGRSLSRCPWRILQQIGIKTPISPAKTRWRRINVEKRLIKWVKIKDQMLIAGHTHRAIFPSRGEPQYFNGGSCVHPRCITGIEIQDDEIVLIKWSVGTRDDGVLYVAREVLEGPRRLFG